VLAKSSPIIGRRRFLASTPKHNAIYGTKRIYQIPATWW
jgi:hypothetical protein